MFEPTNLAETIIVNLDEIMIFEIKVMPQVDNTPNTHLIFEFVHSLKPQTVFTQSQLEVWLTDEFGVEAIMDLNIGAALECLHVFNVLEVINAQPVVIYRRVIFP
jgi:hypothetical protein